MDAQMYRQHRAHARSRSLHVSVADLASASLVLWPGNIRGVTRRLSTGKEMSSTFPTATQHLISCHCSKLLFVPTGSRWSSEARRKERGKKERAPSSLLPHHVGSVG